MKKIYFTLGLSALLFGANAQQFKKISTANKKVMKGHNNWVAKTQSTVTDTLLPVTFQGTGCGVTGNDYYYPMDVNNVIDTGYVFGTNSFPYVITTPVAATLTISYTESAQKYNVTGNASITGVLVAAGTAYSSAATTSITAKIYSENTTTKAPKTQLGATSTGKTLQSFLPYDGTVSSYNLLSFATPVAVSNQNFFASVVSPFLGGTTHDSLAILGSDAGSNCSSTDSLSWLLQNAYNGASVVQSKWYSVIGQFGGSNLDLMIFPIVSITSNAGIDKVTK